MKYDAMVLDVIDGDTLDVLVNLGFGVSIKQRVRLYQIDAPELSSEAGKKALDYVKTLGLGRVQLDVPSGVRDKYGRCLGDVFFLYNGDYYSLCNMLLINDHARRLLYGEEHD
jgi:endonuclease YncB( thermonuclease family)